jgi:hypothetical protein
MTARTGGILAAAFHFRRVNLVSRGGHRKGALRSLHASISRVVTDPQPALHPGAGIFGSATGQCVIIDRDIVIAEIDCEAKLLAHPSNLSQGGALETVPSKRLCNTCMMSGCVRPASIKSRKR